VVVDCKPLAAPLGVLRENGVVYGDLRPNNIMCREREFGVDEEIDKGEELEMKVIDFDMAGKVGLARYSQVLNDRIPWPGGGGSWWGKVMIMLCWSVCWSLFRA
jgi:serine/threonine protein kinase